MQLAQPRRIEHRTRAPDPTNPKYVGRIGTDGARRATRQLNHQQQHAVPPLKRPRRQQTPEQRMGLRDNPHIARQHRTQLLQSVAFTPGTGKTHLLIGLGLAACEEGRRVRYVTTAQLVNELVEAANERVLSRVVARYGRLDLLCLNLSRAWNYAEARAA